MAKTFEVEIKFEDREKGPGTVAGKAIVTAGTMAAAIGKGVREILDKTDRKQNFPTCRNTVSKFWCGLLRTRASLTKQPSSAAGA